MIIIPAIDLKDGQCVRLRKGVMKDTTVFSNNPTEMAAKWVNEGARRLHLVDLNGAFEGKPINADCINEITKSFPPEEKYSLTDQIRRSSRSVCTNLAEA